MPHRSLPCLALSLALAAFAMPAAADPVYTGDVLVKLRDDVPSQSWHRRERLSATVETLATERRLPLRLLDTLGGRWLRLQPTAVLTAAEHSALWARLREDPRLLEVVPERREFPLAVTPSDTRFAEQWWLQPRAAGNTGVGDFSTAWARRPAAAGPVAVLDSGITFHPDLAANVLPGYDFVSDADYAGDGDGRDDDPRDEGDRKSVV